MIVLLTTNINNINSVIININKKCFIIFFIFYDPNFIIIYQATTRLISKYNNIK